MDFDEGAAEQPPITEPVELCIRLKTVSNLSPKVEEGSQVMLEMIVGNMRLWASPEQQVSQSSANWRLSDGGYPQHPVSLPPGTFLFSYPCSSFCL